MVGGSTSTHTTVCYLLLCVVGDHQSDQPLTCATCAILSESPVGPRRGKFKARVISALLLLISKPSLGLSFSLFMVWGKFKTRNESENSVEFYLISCVHLICMFDGLNLTLPCHVFFCWRKGVTFSWGPRMCTEQAKVGCQEILRQLHIGGLCKCWNAVEVEGGYKYLPIWNGLLLWLVSTVHFQIFFKYLNSNISNPTPRIHLFVGPSVRKFAAS